MRPASEINSALELLADGVEKFDNLPFCNLTDEQMKAYGNLWLARDVLKWVMGGELDIDGETAWLVAYLLDDPQKLDGTSPEVN